MGGSQGELAAAGPPIPIVACAPGEGAIMSAFFDFDFNARCSFVLASDIDDGGGGGIIGIACAPRCAGSKRLTKVLVARGSSCVKVK